MILLNTLGPGTTTIEVETGQEPTSCITPCMKIKQLCSLQFKITHINRNLVVIKNLSIARQVNHMNALTMKWYSLMVIVS